VSALLRLLQNERPLLQVQLALEAGGLGAIEVAELQLVLGLGGLDQLHLAHLHLPVLLRAAQDVLDVVLVYGLLQSQLVPLYRYYVLPVGLDLAVELGFLLFRCRGVVLNIIRIQGGL